MTTFPADMISTTFQFGLSDDAGQVENAEFTLWQQGGSPDLPTDWDAGLLGLATEAYGSWVSHATTSWFSTFVKLVEVKSAHYNTAGHTLQEQTYSAGTLWVGTASGASLPWQISLCVSLYGYQPGTFTPDNKSKRGRVFLPPMATALIANNANGELDNSHVLQACNLVKGIVNDLSGYTLPTAPSGIVQLVSVFSRKNQNTVPITYVSADNKWDTQRRRVHQLDSVRQSVHV